MIVLTLEEDGSISREEKEAKNVPEKVKRLSRKKEVALTMHIGKLGWVVFCLSRKLLNPLVVIGNKGIQILVKTEKVLDKRNGKQ